MNKHLTNTKTLILMLCGPIRPWKDDVCISSRAGKVFKLTKHSSFVYQDFDRNKKIKPACCSGDFWFVYLASLGSSIKNWKESKICHILSDLLLKIHPLIEFFYEEEKQQIVTGLWLWTKLERIDRIVLPTLLLQDLWWWGSVGVGRPRPPLWNPLFLAGVCKRRLYL